MNFQSIEQTKYISVWQMCLSQIKKSTSEEEYARWFQPIEPIGFTNDILRLRVPSQRHLQHIEQNFIRVLAPIVRTNFGVKASIRYAVPQEDQSASIRGYSTQPDVATIKNPFIIPGLKKVKFDSQLRAEYNFDNFIEGSCNRLLRSAGLSISVNPGTTSFNPLFIYGSSGLGKTHLAQAIGNATVARHANSRVLYVSANRFQSQFQYAAHHGELNDFINFYQMIDVLIIDDIQELAGKSKTQNIFFNIFNHLHMLGKQLILTSDRPPVELKDIEERLITRFKWGLSGELTPPDKQTRTTILHSKIKNIHLEVSEEVIAFLADNIKSNVRELEGALTSLEAYSRLMGQPLSIDLARRVLRDIVEITTTEVTIESILNLVSSHFGIELPMLLSKKRTRDVAQARQVAMYLCKKHTKAALSAIGSAVGGKNHATVLHSCKTIADIMETDKVLSQKIQEIERKLKY
ncbi:MAG: chromosomal replication initiator protein DnaA [Mucinivorans sp.]